jgi:hypothetical protein
MKPQIPTPSLPFCSFLYREDLLKSSDFSKTWEDWFKKSTKFHHPFCSMKEYYSKEMGPSDSLNRFFLIGLEQVPREIILSGKIKAQMEEKKFSVENARMVNIDFGVISLENLILATNKPFAHRIYMTDGIYQELTYFFQNKTFNTLPWTYPDYAHPEILNFFNLARNILLSRIRENETLPSDLID